MNARPKNMSRRFLNIVAEILAVPAFFVVFCILYDPFHIRETLSFGSFSFGFHIVMLGCIILVLLIPMSVIRQSVAGNDFYKRMYQILWYVGEIFVIACFMALYINMFRHGEDGWFQTLALCLKYAFLILCYPYAIVAVIRQYGIYRIADDMARAENDERTLVKLYDEHGRLRLSLQASAILFIRADANYVSVNYLEGGKEKEYTLRSSLKRMEECLAGYGLIKCHRSYVVNPKHVIDLGKNADGYMYATLNDPLVTRIPVTKQYCDSLSALLL